jgi:hypothetical protein
MPVPAAMVMTILSAVVLGWSGSCAAQMYRPERLQSFDDAPASNLMLSSAAVRALDSDFDDLRALGAFGGGKRGVDRFPRPVEVEGPRWTLYGRFYLLNFRNHIDEPEARMQFTWRRTGPRIAGSRIYVGAQFRF